MAVLDFLTANIRYSQAKSLVRDIERKEKRKLRVLDAGGADGSFYKWLRKRGHKVYTLDLKNSDVVANLEYSLPFKDKSFDLVVSLAVVEHLNNWNEALEEFKRVAEYVILTSPTPLAKPVLDFLAKLNLVNREHIRDHKHYLTKSDFEKHGYKTFSFLFGFNRAAYYGFDIDRGFSPWFYLVLVLILVIFMPKLPPDDLLRHLSAYRYGFDYRKMFLYSYCPSFDFYLPFDYVAGMVHRLLGNQYAFIPFQVLDVVLFGTGIILLTRDKAPKSLQTLILAFSFYALADRLLLGRPAVITEGIFLIAFALRERRELLHFFMGVLMSVSYYLFFIYLIPLAFFRRAYILAMAFGFAFWTAVGGKGYYGLLYHIATAKSHRLISVAEGVTIYSALLSSAALSLIPVLYYCKKDLKTFLTGLYFTLSNQIRYVDTIVPLWSSLGKYYGKDIDWKVLVPSLLFLISPFTIVPKVNYVAFDKPVKVAFSDMPPMYRSVYFSKANIQVVPSMELGWVREDVQEFLKDLWKGKFDCSKARKYGFDYIVENTLNLNKIPACLRLERTKGEYRVWKVIK